LLASTRHPRVAKITLSTGSFSFDLGYERLVERSLMWIKRSPSLPYGDERLTLIIGTSLIVERGQLIDDGVWFGSRAAYLDQVGLGPLLEVKPQQ
jgi:hypothetical protein